MFGASRLAYLAKTAAAGGATYRSDTYSSNVYLALPFDSTNQFDDVSPEINSSSTQATASNGPNSSITSTQVKWTSTPNYTNAFENGGDVSGVASSSYALSTSIPSVSGTYVVEGWFYANDNRSNYNWTLSSADSGGRWLFSFNTTTTISFGSENNVGIGTGWAHVAVVCDSGTRRLYVNGLYKGQWTSSNTGFSTLHVGQFNAGDTRDFDGHIQDLRVTIGSNRGYTGTNTGSANFTLPSSIVESF